MLGKVNIWWKWDQINESSFIDFHSAMFFIPDVKLNETSLKFYRYDNKGNPLATPKGGYIGTITKTDIGTFEFMDVGQSLTFGSKSVSNIYYY